MDSQFAVYAGLGFEHILDFQGFDHILFIITLCSVYVYSEWKKVAILVTAFTVGHSLTLALVAFKVITINAYVVEVLIPVTILCTALYNSIWGIKAHKNVYVPYMLTLCFGLIHGMGFSNFFTTIMGEQMDILKPLLYFNIGLEVGQLLVVALFFVLNIVTFKLATFPQKYWTWAFSGIAGILALFMIVERI